MNIINLLTTSINPNQQINNPISSSNLDVVYTINPSVILLLGFITSLISGIYFASIMKRKLLDWESQRKSPLPLGSYATRISWGSFFIGLTFIFTGALQIFNFPLLASLVFSIINALLFGIIMWNAIKDLMVQLKEGTLKEIDDFI